MGIGNYTTFPFFLAIKTGFSVDSFSFVHINRLQNMNKGVFPLKGVVQHYAWGGSQFIPVLLGMENHSGEPFAEYWLGVHPKGPATVMTEKGEQQLSDFFAEQPAYLGTRILEEFGALPFLLKVLDVKKMLSIQLHPTRSKAQAGFAKEEEAGIPRLAPYRNYKDQNHKPEVMVALNDFWLLHGFQSLEVIRKSLENNPGWATLLPHLDQEGIRGLYKYVMQLSDAEVSILLEPLYLRLKEQQAVLEKDHPDFWAWRAYEQYSKDGLHDRGVFSIYWFNLVRLAAGEGIFQGAGIPHAYLEGVNVELMANSDNVLRGGLTPKHIDVKELLANIITEPVEPNILKGISDTKSVVEYPIPIPDFALRKLNLLAGEALFYKEEGAAIYIVLEGAVTLNDELYQQGQCCLAVDGASMQWQALGADSATIYKAYVNE